MTIDSNERIICCSKINICSGDFTTEKIFLEVICKLITYNFTLYTEKLEIVSPDSYINKKITFSCNSDISLDIDAIQY